MRRLTDGAGAGTWTKMVPLGRFASAEEIGTLAVILCSPLSAYVTGVQLSVDGGIALSGSGLFNQALETARS